MTPSERLKAIEIVVKYHLPNLEETTPYPLKTESIEWLINRVKQLTEALEFYANGEHFEYCGKQEFEPENPSGEPINWECGGDEGSEFQFENGGIARKALEGEEWVSRVSFGYLTQE